MMKSESIGQLAKALSAAQGEILGAKKESTNPFFKAAYSDLSSVIEAIRGPFLKNGLAFSQPADTSEDGAIIVETIIMHTSGEWISGRLAQKPLKPDPQTTGSLISYLKRYGLQALAGVPSIDDDAESAQARGNDIRSDVSTKTNTLTNNSYPKVTEPQLKRLFAISQKNNWSTADVKSELAKLGVSDSSELVRAQYDKLINIIETSPKTIGTIPH